MKTNQRKFRIETEWLMILPAIMVLVVITVYPFLFTIRMSFMNFPMIQTRNPSFIGLGNWIRMFNDFRVKMYWITTLKFVLGALTIEMFLGIIIALLLDKIEAVKDFFVTLTMFPLFFAPVLVGLIGRFIFHESYGIYTYFLTKVGLLENVGIFGQGSTALLALIALDIWEWTPLIVIIVLAGLNALPIEPFEAALVDGASGLQKLRFITMPLLKPVIFVALLIRTMDVLRYYEPIFVTTRGGPADATKVVSIAVYDQAFQAYQMGYAATLTLSMILVTTLLANIFIRFFFSKEKGVDSAI